MSVPVKISQRTIRLSFNQIILLRLLAHRPRRTHECHYGSLRALWRRGLVDRCAYATDPYVGATWKINDLGRQALQQTGGMK